MPKAHADARRIRLITGSWLGDFRDLVVSARESLLLAAPFVTHWPLEVVEESLDGRRLNDVSILTNFSVNSLADRSVDPGALARFCERRGETRVFHLPGLHAKAYIADRTRAIVTSANLTMSAIRDNIEAGVTFTGMDAGRLAGWLDAHAAVGVRVVPGQLMDLERVARTFEATRRRTDPGARAAVAEALNATVDHLRQLRAQSGRSTNSVFSATVRLALTSGPKTTPELHAIVQAIHPDLCDDSIDRVINGVHFGRRWKHMVRNAQQHLKGQGIIDLSRGQWQLA